MRIESASIGMVTTRPVVVDEDATLRELAVLLDREGIGVALVQGVHSTVIVSERDMCGRSPTVPTRIVSASATSRHSMSR